MDHIAGSSKLQKFKHRYSDIQIDTNISVPYQEFVCNNLQTHDDRIIPLMLINWPCCSLILNYI